MTTKAAFTPEEWTDIIQAPMAAALSITVASPSLFGSMGEIMSAGRTLTAGAQQATGIELLDALLAEFKQTESAKAVQPKMTSHDQNEVKVQLRAILTRAVAALQVKATPEEAGAIQKLTFDIAVGAANASKEGGFLGIGAVRVSPAEQATLDELAAILGVMPAGGANATTA